jgi:RNA polymerase sigma factor (sigma-70 family)
MIMRSRQTMPDPVQDAEFSKFYKASFPRLVAFLRVTGAPYAIAVDCAQEAMIKALPPVWAVIENPHAWCRRTCRNFYLRHVERNREESVGDLEQMGHPLIAPDTDFREVEQHFTVLQLLKKLSPRRRQVMAYVYDDAPYEEIAEALDMSVATVRSTCRDARAQLATLLEENGDELR